MAVFQIVSKKQISLPFLKNDDPFDKSSYRPLRVLPLISIVYERLSIIRIHRKFFIYPLFKLLKSWQKELDNGGFVGAILMDLSKVYDCIPHELLIAKLKCYGIKTEICDYY